MVRNALVLGALVLAGAAGTASADTVVATFNGLNPSRSVSYSLNSGGDWHNTSAGAFNFTRTGGTHVGSPTGSFVAFCIELTESNIGVGQSRTYDVTDPALAPESDPMGTTRRNLMRELFGRFYGTLNLSSADQCAAFQIAVWEIVYDSGTALNGGSFRVANPMGNGYYNMAQNWLNALNGTGPMANISALVDDTRQDMIVPTPGTAALAGLGLLAVGRRRR